MVDSYPHDWTLKLRFMREHGVVSAKWDGELLASVEIDLGHQSPSTPPTIQQDEPKVDPKEVRQRTMMGAVPALVGRSADR